MSHHPDHDVGEAGDPQGGEDKGEHEPVVPAWFGAVGDSEVEQQAERPGKQPLQFIANTRCKYTPQPLNNPEKCSGASFAALIIISTLNKKNI